MELEFRRADVEKELRRLREFDRRIFPAADLFPASYWRECEVWWMIVAGRRAGCCAFQRGVEFRDDLDGCDPPSEHTLYISSTGILPSFQGRGYGRLMKAWQVAYAQHHGFRRIVTNTRASNEAMIALNLQFGFRIVRTTPGYYAGPVEATIVMDRIL
jgi:ribosomal protein S18 acetylase RimI-like enzyme